MMGIHRKMLNKVTTGSAFGFKRTTVTVEWRRFWEGPIVKAGPARKLLYSFRLERMVVPMEDRGWCR